MPILAGAVRVSSGMAGSALALTIDTTGMDAAPLLVWGEADGVTWWVRGGRGGRVVLPGEVLTLLDPLAPLNTAIIYTVQVGSDTDSVAGYRAYAGWHAITDLNGRGLVDFFRLDDGDARTATIRQAQFTIPGRDRPVIRYETATDGGTNWEGRTTGVDTTRMRDLIHVGAPVILLHNRARCPLDPCDLEGAEIALITSSADKVTGNRLEAEREWSLSFTFADDPFADVITPLSTVADFDAYWAGRTVGEHDVEWGSRTVAEHAGQAWSE